MSKTAAVIDLGSNSIRLTIFEERSEGKIDLIDSLSQPLRLGKDTFVLSAIRNQHFDEAVEILKGFQRVMQEYDVHKIIGVATSAVREAINGMDFIDYIYNKSGIILDILEDTEETKFIFNALESEFGKNKDFLKGTSLVIEVGAGNVKTIFIKDGLITFSQVHKIGALRVQEILNNINVRQHKFEKVLKEFIRTDIQLLFSELPMETLDRMIVIGVLVPELLSHISPDTLQIGIEIPTPEFKNILEKYRDVSLIQFSRELELSAEKADILLPSLHIFSDFLEVFLPKMVLLSNVALTDGLIQTVWKGENDFSPHVNASVKYLGQKYHNDDLHALVVQNISEEIFNKTIRIHNLKKSDLLILKVAAWLHDIGRYVNGREHHKHSEYLIAHASIPGLTKKQLNMAAVVARNHRRFEVKYGDNLNAAFSPKDRLKIRKLSAILRVANSLDLGHENSSDDILIRYQKKKKRLIFEIQNPGEYILEEWGFNSAKELFEKIFNVECNWQQKDNQ